ncbi:cytochrome P450 [Exidia glandulosa HHB12029]|uniref:Cytochrome P450 n=1 Tax=Exidia glandulosa HHB12029 TaxID=1314781 RepID=A0A165J2H4_EXIGL|nr:cytochrome P450 [Exidia glandulosa HHB12029]
MFFAISVAVAFLLAVALGRSRWRTRLPPGPRRVPIFGNALSIPVNDAWLQFAQWRKEHGSLVYLELLGQPALVLNTHRAAIDLLTRRARIYSDRPWNYVAAQLLTGGHFMPFMDHNDRWRGMRRASQEGLRKATVARYRQIQYRESIRAVIGLLVSPAHWEEHLLTNSASVILSSVYGSPPTAMTDPIVRTSTGFTERLARAVYPGAYLVETIPFLRFVPFWAAPWKRNALRSYQSDSKLFYALFENGRLINPVGSTPFARIAAEHMDSGALSSQDAAWLCATMFTAGVETTSASLCWFVLAMILHPQVQASAQDELERVVGSTRLPSYDDMEKLPYIRAIIREVLRWRPPLPLGLPHRLSEDDVYDGFHIPSGTLCIANVWEINHDKDVWGDDADNFRPQRHLDDDGNLDRTVFTGHDDQHGSFGFGRRICIGRHFAADTLFITCATILWACNLKPETLESGAAAMPSDYAHPATGMTLHPAPFKCKIEPRNPDVSHRLQVEREALQTL